MSVRWLVGWLVCLLVGRSVFHNFLQGLKVTLPCCCRRRKTVTDNSSRVVVVNQNNPSIFLFIYVFVYLSLHLYIYVYIHLSLPRMTWLCLCIQFRIPFMLSRWGGKNKTSCQPKTLGARAHLETDNPAALGWLEGASICWTYVLITLNLLYI